MAKKSIIFKIELIVFLIIFLFLFSILTKETYHYFLLKKDYSKSYNKLKELENKQTKLNQEINYLSQDKNLLKKARSEMNLLKPGEKVIVLLDNNLVKKATSTPLKKESLFEKIINFFKF